MKPALTVFAILSLSLLASAAFAQGLEITEINVDVDYDEAYTYRIENKDRLSSASVPVTNSTKINVDILPGSNVTFTLRVENTFNGDEPKIRDAFATITIEDFDDGADLEEKSLDFDLEPGNDYRADVKFQIPLSVDAGTYKIRMEVEGESKNNTLYKTELNQKLEVKKQSHDIRIAKASLNPSIVDCNRKARLTAEIVNVGSNAENQVGLEFKSASLGVNSVDRDIFLGSSDEASEKEKTYVKTLNIELPSLFKAGAYEVFVNLYWKNFVLFDQKIVELAVKDCGKETSQKTGEKQERISEEKGTTIPETAKKPQYNSTLSRTFTIKKLPIFKSPIAWVLVLGVFLIAAIVYAILRIKKFK